MVDFLENHYEAPTISIQDGEFLEYQGDRRPLSEDRLRRRFCCAKL